MRGSAASNPSDTSESKGPRAGLMGARSRTIFACALRSNDVVNNNIDSSIMRTAIVLRPPPVFHPADPILSLFSFFLSLVAPRRPVRAARAVSHSRLVTTHSAAPVRGASNKIAFIMSIAPCAVVRPSASVPFGLSPLRPSRSIPAAIVFVPSDSNDVPGWFIFGGLVGQGRRKLC